MTAQILLPLGTSDRTDALIPYIEKVARPGVKVVFLLPFPVGGPRYTFHTDSFLLPRADEMMNHYSWEGNLQRALRKLSFASEVLHPKGVEVAVDGTKRMAKPIRYRTRLICAMSKLRSLSEKLFLVVLAIGFPEEIGRLRYLLWTASLLDSGRWRISTLLQLCQNYMTLCVRIGKIWL